MMYAFLKSANEKTLFISIIASRNHQQEKAKEEK